MKVYILFYHNESGDSYIDNVLDYMPTMKEMVEWYEDSYDVIKDEMEDEKPSFHIEKDGSAYFSWQYMNVKITEHEIETRE